MDVASTLLDLLPLLRTSHYTISSDATFFLPKEGLVVRYNLEFKQKKGVCPLNRRNFMRASTVGLAVATGVLATSEETSAAKEDSVAEAFKTPDPEALAEAVHRHFITGKKTCGEAMLLGCIEVLDIESSLIPDIALGMGGGIGLQGRTCGIVTGAAMVTGVVVGSREEEYKKRKMRVFSVCGKFLQWYENERGTLLCRKISELDLTTPEGRDKLKAGVKVNRCGPIIRTAARMLAEILRDDEQNPSYVPPASTLTL